MKQKIGKKQISELTEEQLQIYEKWCVDRNYGLYLSIGQMIEFLCDFEERPHFSLKRIDKLWQIDFMKLGNKAWYELCDSLWSAVKYIIKEDKPNE